MHVQVDESGHHPAARHVQDLHAFTGQRMAGIRAYARDASVFNDDVCDGVEATRGVEDTSSSEHEHGAGDYASQHCVSTA
jgi:hypothetical protein